MSSCRLVMGLTVATLLFASSLNGAESKSKRFTGDRVELFAALEADQVAVKLIPKNAEQATDIVENKTKRPLSIKMPEAFVGMPVLAQDFGGGGNDRGGGGGSNQAMGGGMGMMGGMGGMGMGGFFNVGPERVGKIKVKTVCLEHGKEDPNPRVPYELKPITAFTQNAELIEVCRMLGNQKIDQVSAQAAAWHLSDGLTWQQLAAKVKVRHLNGRQTMFFNALHLNKALAAVQEAKRRTQDSEQDPEATSPGELSVSQR